MAHFLPPPVMAYFQPRPLQPPTPQPDNIYDEYYMTPPDVPHLGIDLHAVTSTSTPVSTSPSTCPSEISLPPSFHYTGVSTYSDALKSYNYKPQQQPPTAATRRVERKSNRIKRNNKRIEKMRPVWQNALKKKSDAGELTGDAYKTLFIGRLHYDTTEEDIAKEMKYYGPVKKIIIVRNKRQQEEHEGKMNGTSGSHVNKDTDMVNENGATSNGTTNRRSAAESIEMNGITSKRSDKKSTRGSTPSSSSSSKAKEQDQEKGKPRTKHKTWAFVEFESSRDLTEAYKDMDGRKIRGRRCVVDVERGRTVKGWYPKRLGGGLGKTRVGSTEQNQQHSGREARDHRTSSSSASTPTVSSTSPMKQLPPPSSSSSYRTQSSSSRERYGSDRTSGYDVREKVSGSSSWRGYERDGRDRDRDRGYERSSDDGYYSRDHRDDYRKR